MTIQEATEEFERLCLKSSVMQKMKKRAWKVYLAQLVEYDEITQEQADRWEAKYNAL